MKRPLLAILCLYFFAASISAQVFFPAETLIDNTGVGTTGTSAVNYVFQPIDLNNDGVLHFLGKTNTDSQLDFYINDGSGNFTYESVSTSSAVSPVLSADFNNDNIVDILTTSRIMMQGDGANEYTAVWNDNQGSQDEVRVDVGDFNMDGNMDYISLHFFQERLIYYQGDGNLQFTPTLIEDHPTNDHGYVTVSDYDQDGDLDIVECDDDFRFFENDGSGGFSLDKVVSAGNLQNKDDSFCKLEDLDNDGDLDLLGVDINWGLYYLINDQGTYDTDAIRISSFPTFSFVFTSVIEDFNGDGFLDVVSLEEMSGTNRVMYYENMGGNGFADALNIHEMDAIAHVQNTGRYKRYVNLMRCLDYDNDGKKDLIINDIKGQKIIRIEYNGLLPDVDMDGFTSDVDCDDNNAMVYPGATEICDGLDNNCDNQIDEGLPVMTYYTDADGDGFGADGTGFADCMQPAGMVLLDGDCDDTNAEINPDAVDIPGNMIDEDCDGMDTSSTYELNSVSIEIFPNPTIGRLNISIDGDLNHQVILYDLQGRQLLTSKDLQIDLSLYSEGVYLLRVIDLDQGASIVERVVLSK